MSRGGIRWSTKFGRWVHTYGVRRLATDLGQAQPPSPVTVSGVHEWLAGRSTPRLQTAITIERMSAGAVHVEDIVAHQEQVRR